MQGFCCQTDTTVCVCSTVVWDSYQWHIKIVILALSGKQEPIIQKIRSLGVKTNVRFLGDNACNIDRYVHRFASTEDGMSGIGGHLFVQLPLLFVLPIMCSPAMMVLPVQCSPTIVILPVQCLPTMMVLLVQCLLAQPVQ